MTGKAKPRVARASAVVEGGVGPRWQDGLDEEELAAGLIREEQAAIGFDDGELAEQQRIAVDAYHGRPYGDEEAGRSQFVTRDVAEAVDYMTVAVLRAFVSGDHVVEFEGHPKAREVTAAMHTLFLRRQNGYRLLHDWLKGGLLEKIGVIKTSVEEETKVATERGRIDALTLAQLQEEGAEIVAATPAGIDDAAGEPLFDVVVRHAVTRTCFRDHTVPVDEFRFAARTVSEESSAYLAHVVRKTRSQLVEMGHDADAVYDLPADQGTDDLDPRKRSRFGVEDDGWRAAESDPANQEVLLREEYVFRDADGDGIAERLRVTRVDKVILAAEEADDQPFVVFCPFPMPGVMVGQSLADKVLDIQRLRTVTTRLTLDGFYVGISPRTYVHEGSIGENTLDDLLTVRPNSIVRWKGNVPPTTQDSGFNPSDALAMLEFASGEKEARTGITRLNQGLDRDALNKTATGTALMQNQGAQIEEYIARNFGECLARLFDKKLKLLTRHGEPFQVNIDGQPVMVDPRGWPSEMDMNVQVGLGSGRKDQRIAYRQMIIGLQAQAKQGGVGLVTPKQLFNSAAGIVADTNLGSVSDYFTDPESPEGQRLAQAEAQASAAPPDPGLAKARADAQLQAARLQMDRQRAEADLTLDAQAGAAKLRAMREENALKLDLERQKAVAEADLAKRRMEMEFALAERRLEHERAQGKAVPDGIGALREGGRLDQ